MDWNAEPMRLAAEKTSLVFVSASQVTTCEETYREVVVREVEICEGATCEVRTCAWARMDLHFEGTTEL